VSVLSICVDRTYHFIVIYVETIVYVDILLPYNHVDFNHRHIDSNPKSKFIL